MAVAAATGIPNWRLELFYKSADELAAQVPFLRSQCIRRVNLPNKRSEDDLVGAVKALASAATGIDGLDVCVHYSVKYQYDRSPAGAAAKLDKLYAELQACCPPGAQLSVLVVSGGGQKKRYDSVAAVQQLARRHQAPPLPLHVAFNPYLPGEQQSQERERLRQKLATKKVAGVYLQIGTDLARLEQALQYASGLIDELYGAARGAQRPVLHGSVLLPSARLLAQMKFRPWTGVFLSEEYLSSVEAADSITRQLLRLYAAHDVVPLVETSVRSAKELAYAQDLLAAAVPAP